MLWWFRIADIVLIHFRDDLLSLAEFTLICRALFRNDKGHIYVVADDQLQQMFAVFDKNDDGFIDRDEFHFCWNYWIKTVSAKQIRSHFRLVIVNFAFLQIVRPINAFLIVDVQNDFITGTLSISNCSARHEGDEVIYHLFIFVMVISQLISPNHCAFRVLDHRADQ